jgi:cell division protein FtsN
MHSKNETQGMKQQRGGTLLGFIIGVVVGLAVALAVAVYVTKVPVPFMNKGQTRSADQDVEEAKKNKDWDPNAPLYGKNPVKPVAPALPAEAAALPPAAPASRPVVQAPESKPVDAKAPEAKAPESKKPEAKAAASADPIGDLARAKTAAADAEPFVYWVQVGAYRTMEDAESQRAKLSLSGIETKISEREQSGRTVYRVRVGPFEKKEDGEKSKEKLDKSGLETALVRVQR